MKKYKLIDETISIVRNGVEITLYRIKALKKFANVEAGERGGYIESEDNLSHDGNCWIYDNSKVFGNAKVCGNAEIYGNAEVSGYAKVCGGTMLGV